MSRRDDPGRLSLLADILHGVPLLDGARCRQRHELFDPAEASEGVDDVEYRYNAAVRICRACPAIQECAAWVDSLPRNRGPSGVVAGRRPDSGRAAA